MHPDLLKELVDYDPIAVIAESINPEAVAGRHLLDIAQCTCSKTQLEGQILNWGGDQMDMANSMESRLAFLDHRLAEVAVQIPPGYRIRNNIEKWALREAVKGVLPEVLDKQEKSAFMALPAHTDTLKQLQVQKPLDEVASPAALESADLPDSQSVRQFSQGYQEATDPVALTRKDTLISRLLWLQILSAKPGC